MPYGADHGYRNKETNSQDGGKTDSKTSIHKGPAAGGGLNHGEMKSVFTPIHGKGGKPAKQVKGAY